MSALTRFMAVASAVLLDHDARRSQQPPLFVRTRWLFAELGRLATASEEILFEELTVARIEHDVPAVTRILALVYTNTLTLPMGTLRHQRDQLHHWIVEQLEKETHP